MPTIVAPAALRRAAQAESWFARWSCRTFELQVVAQDLDSFSSFALQRLINLPNVKDLHTSFSLGEVKASGVLPLGHLKG